MSKFDLSSASGSVDPVRRRLLAATLAAAAVAASGRVRAQALPAPRAVSPDHIHVWGGRAARPLDLLMLGGTVFVGAAVVKAALARGHRVTLFNRGHSNPQLFPDLPRLQGDRLLDPARGLAALEGRRFDAAIDTWADAPLAVRRMAQQLEASVERYLYVSTISVYDPPGWGREARITEESPLRPVPDVVALDDPAMNYGLRKRLGEDFAREVFGERFCAVRPHQILGWHVARSSAGQRYWPMRFVHGGDILLPGDGLDATQFIDVGDLGSFIVHLLEQRASGSYNSMRTLRWDAFATDLARLPGAARRTRWVDAATLERHGLRPMGDVPMWVPRHEGPGFMGHDATRAEAAGLRHRPVGATLRDIVGGTAEAFPEGFAFQTSESERPLSLARERALLARIGA